MTYVRSEYNSYVFEVVVGNFTARMCKGTSENSAKKAEVDFVRRMVVCTTRDLVVTRTKDLVTQR